MKRIPVWLDCDPGHDDALAIILAGHSPRTDLLGISTVAGNQTVEKVTNNALRVLQAAGLDSIGEAAERVLDEEPVRQRSASVHRTQRRLSTGAKTKCDALRSGSRGLCGLYRTRAPVDSLGRRGPTACLVTRGVAVPSVSTEVSRCTKRSTVIKRMPLNICRRGCRRGSAFSALGAYESREERHAVSDGPKKSPPCLSLSACGIHG